MKNVVGFRALKNFGQLALCIFTRQAGGKTWPLAAFPVVEPGVVPRNHILKQPTQNLPLCSMALFKVLNGPQRSRGRVGLVSVSDALDMGIDNADLPDVHLKTGPAFAQVMP